MMNIQQVVKKWKGFVQRNKELRTILLAQYQSSFIRLLNLYRDYKKRQFQKYILDNSTKLIDRAMKQNLMQVKLFRLFLQEQGVKRYYFHSVQIEILKKFSPIKIQKAKIQAIRLPLQQFQKFKRFVPSNCRQLHNSVVVMNFQQQKLINREVIKTHQIIKYPFLYSFQKEVTVKRSQKIFKFTPEQAKRHKHQLSQINQFQTSEYEVLYQINLDEQGFKTLRKVHQYNYFNVDKIDIILDFQLWRLGAVCRIQKFWRATLNIRRDGMKMKQIMRLINQSRSIFVIQRWFRRMRQLHRTIFFKEISFQALAIQTKNLYLDLEIYQNIATIINNQQYRLKFLEQYSQIFTDDQVARLHFMVPKSDFYGQQTYLQQIQQLKLYPIQPIPTWLLQQIAFVPKEEKTQISPFVIKQKHKQKWQQKNRTLLQQIKQSLKDISYKNNNDIYALLHTGAKIQFEFINNRDYIRFSYNSIVEARYRAIALALLTYRFGYNGTYVKMINDNVWENFNSKKALILKEYCNKAKLVYDLKLEKQNNTIVSQIMQIPIILCTKIKEAVSFDLTSMPISLYFYNDSKRVSADIFYLFKFDIDEKEQQSQDFSSKSTQIPVKFSILQVEPPQQEIIKTNRLEQSHHIMTSKYKTQTQNINTSSIIKDSQSERIAPDQFDTKSVRMQYQEYLDKIQYNDVKQNQIKVNLMKASNKKKKNEKIFENDFIQLTTLLQRQERNVNAELKRQSQQQRSLSFRYKEIKVDSKVKRGKSFHRPLEILQPSDIVFPQIEKKYKQATLIQSKLSVYHRHAIFPEELYAIENKNTLQY